MEDAVSEARRNDTDSGAVDSNPADPDTTVPEETGSRPVVSAAPEQPGAPGPLAGLRVLLVHAHPDDESILTGGTIATLAAGGARVVNVTCTLGEEGEVLGEQWQGLVAAEADQLGGYRVGELRAALAALGLPGPTFLGGAGAWRDSGMEGTPSFEHPRAFARLGAERERAQETQLARIIDRERPHLVLTYDPVGWYGHPDHIRAHDLAHAAARRSAWAVPRISWIVVPIGVLEADAEAWDEPAAHGYVAPESRLRPAALGELPGWPDEEVTHAVELSAEATARRDAALAAHATQLELHPRGAATPTHLALTNELLQPLARREYYVSFDLVQGEGSSGSPGHGSNSPDDDGRPARLWHRPAVELDPVSGRPLGQGHGSVVDRGWWAPPWEGLPTDESFDTEERERP